MQRITTNVDEGVYLRLEEIARRRSVPTAQVIREALERYVADEEARQEPQPLPDWVGMLDGPGGPYAERDEEILARSWGQDLEPSTDLGASTDR
jgi:predicted transcriptional regulator